jgi:dTDP-4-amino-4,6-dideoxygalactose transaminase
MAATDITLESIPISRPTVSPDDLEVFRGALETGWITMGPAVAEFERRIADLVGVPALATSSCTAAMHLALIGWGIGPGDEVIVPALSFVATAHAVAQTGATPVFVDVDPDILAMAPAAVTAALTPRTRALIPVHLYGIPAPMDELRAICDAADLRLLEDAAAALGGTYRGRPCGSLGDAGAFSFHPRKVITTGEGGMLTTADSDLLALARAQRNHGAGMAAYDRQQLGIGVFPTFDVLGYNYRLTDLAALLGMAQLDRFDWIASRRRLLARRYAEGLGDLEGLWLPAVPDGSDPCWPCFVIALGEGAPLDAHAFQAHMGERRIASLQGVQLLPELGYYRESSGFREGAFPVAERVAREAVSLPLYPDLTDSQQERIIAAVREAWA